MIITEALKKLRPSLKHWHFVEYLTDSDSVTSMIDYNKYKSSIKRLGEQHENYQKEHVTSVVPITHVEIWSRARLGKCITMNDQTYSPKEAWATVNYLETGNITENRVEAIQCLNLNKDKLPSRARRKVELGDIVFSTVRPNQRHFGLMRHVPENFLASTGFVVIRAKENIADTGFIYWFLTQDRIVNRLHTIAEHSTSTYPSIRPADIESLEIDLPPLPEQRAIAHILGTLDDKIELNQKMNQTLEEIAKAIFKSWFVDFDPVRAKAEGRPTGLPPEISDLFPDELVDSEIGEIPQGWELLPLGDFIFEVGKKTKPSTETECNPYVPIDCISSKSLTLSEYKNGEEANSSLVAFKRGDILFGAMRPYFHKVCVAPFDGTTRTTCLVLSSKDSEYFGFSLLTLFLDTTIDFATQNSTGSTIPYIKWKKELETMNVAFPPSELAEIFNKFLGPIIEKLTMSIKQRSVLSELRDALLPKLISGELRIPDAEKFLEEAGI